jgi:ZIP family zinc transporter
LIQTVVFAIGTASAILAGAALGSFWEPPKRLQGALLAFAGGALVTALAFELFQPAERETGLLTAAVLASIADTILPEAFHEGGPLIGFATTAGFLTAYALSALAV